MKLFYEDIYMTSILSKIKVTVLLIFFVSHFSFSQEKGAEIDVPGKIKYTEELFVQTDRDIYIIGESVFFKIFKLNGITRTPGNISQVVYIELLDINSSPVIQLKIGVNGFSGSGSLRLPYTLRTGNYLIRSCTHWMQNFSSDLFSYKRISVINPFEDINKINIPDADQQPDSIAFYPESGSLVTGIETVVGFRCLNVNGNPTQISGIVIDCNNDTLCRVQTDNSGYGFFSIKPSGNGGIYLIHEGNKKNDIKFTLPAVKDSGISFSVKTSPDKDLFKIQIQGIGNINNGGRKMFLLYSPVSIAPIIKEISFEPESEILFQKDILPEGLASIMIIDERGVPVAKRWVYNEKKEQINFSLRLPNRTYSTRDKVKIDITATDNDGNPVKSDLMVSVVRSFSVDRTNSGNWPGHMQLPFLAGMTTNYEYFDINDYLIVYSNEGALLQTDTRNSEVNTGYLPEMRGHMVSGIIKNATTGETLNNENIVLSFVGETARCIFSKTDDNGCFNFVISEYGTREIVIQPLSPKLDDYNIELNNPFPVTSDRYSLFPYYPDSSRLAEINKAIISMQVKNIYEPFLKGNSIMPAYNSEPDFYGEQVDTIIVSRFIELATLKEIVKEIVPGVTIYKKNDKYKFKIVNDFGYLPFENDPFMLVDGVPVNDIDILLTLDPGDIRKIEILRNRYLISNIVLEGIIHFITKKGNLSSLEFDKPVFRREFEALQPVYRFDYPDYSVDTLKHSRVPDFRNTLYWNPNLSTEESGEATVEFYTSDETGEYTIIVEGMTSDGKASRSEMPFLVKGAGK